MDALFFSRLLLFVTFICFRFWWLLQVLPTKTVATFVFAGEAMVRGQSLRPTLRILGPAACQCCEGEHVQAGADEGDSDDRSSVPKSKAVSTAEARLRQRLQTGTDKEAERRAKMAEDRRIQQQHDELRARRKQVIEARILARARSLPVLDVPKKGPAEDDIACEGCKSVVLSLKGGVCSYYICLECFCDLGIRVCLCKACYGVKDLLHADEDDGGTHTFIHSDSFTSSSGRFVGFLSYHDDV